MYDGSFMMVGVGCKEFIIQPDRLLDYRCKYLIGQKSVHDMTPVDE